MVERDACLYGPPDRLVKVEMWRKMSGTNVLVLSIFFLLHLQRWGNGETMSAPANGGQSFDDTLETPWGK